MLRTSSVTRSRRLSIESLEVRLALTAEISQLVTKAFADHRLGGEFSNSYFFDSEGRMTVSILARENSEQFASEMASLNVKHMALAEDGDGFRGYALVDEAHLSQIANVSELISISDAPGVAIYEDENGQRPLEQEELTAEKELIEKEEVVAREAYIIETYGSLKVSGALSDVFNPAEAARLEGLQSVLQFEGEKPVAQLMLMSIDADVVQAQLRAIGIETTFASVTPEVMTAVVAVDFASLQLIAQCNEIFAISALPKAEFDSVVTQGDSFHYSDQVRYRLPSGNYSGVKIGVISDGVFGYAAAKASGDLPSSFGSSSINPAQPGLNFAKEGLDMLEVIYDVYPGAQLYFSSAANSAGTVWEGSFSNAVNWLVSQGVDIIVDDVSDYTQPFYFDGGYANAVTSAMNASKQVYYVSSAGNRGRDHWHGDFNTILVGGTQTQQFDNAGDVWIQYVVPNNGTISANLQWSETWSAGMYGRDLRLSIVEANNSVRNWGTGSGGVPRLFATWKNTTGSSKTVGIRVQDITPIPQITPYEPGNELELFISAVDQYGNRLVGVQATDRTYSDELFAQKAVPNVLTVGAIDSLNQRRLYSQMGPSTIYTNFSTQSKTVRSTLDVMALDDVTTSTRVAFNGTSASAAHAAGILGLMRSWYGGSEMDRPSASVMVDWFGQSSIDLPTSGYDDLTGWGKADALAAVYRAYRFAPSSAPDMTASTDTGGSSTDNITGNRRPVFRVNGVPISTTVELYVDGVFRGQAQTLPGNTYADVTPDSDLGYSQHTAHVKIKPNLSSSPGATSFNQTGTLQFTVSMSPPQLLAGGEVWNIDGSKLASVDLMRIFDEAKRRWIAAGVDRRMLAGLAIQVANLDGARLGEVFDRSIKIDVNAAGRGWYVDRTPSDDSEFSSRRNLFASASRRSAASGVDLLTVVMHEIGHALNLDHEPNGGPDSVLMNEEISVGIRRLPSRRLAAQARDLYFASQSPKKVG